MSTEKITIQYDDAIVRKFLAVTLLWGVVGMAAGLLAALQLSHHMFNFNMEWITFGRLRPLHTNAAIFAFVGNMMFAGVYYSTQRLLKVRMASDLLSSVNFWGWQFIIVCAAVTLPLGLSRGKEYAELIWPINVLVAVIWVVFAINFFWTLAKRNEPSIYVAIWFYIATIITVAMLYIVNHLSLPTSLTHSYPIFGGVQDALVQWWYGHNAVAFFLTTPILGIMYYFMPKAAGRPVYSYRLSIVHFWSLVFIYIWAGPHHLLNTALPYWLQILGMTFSLMLWAPSWGGMLNGLLTLRGAWDKLRTDPVIKFFVAGITFYGMSTFEGPLLSIRAVNQLSHYTDWTIGHVHAGTLGWNGFMAAGMIYWLVPRLWKRKDESPASINVGLANLHFWVGLVGILLYVGAMWVAGISQGLQLSELNPDGSVKYGFVETLHQQKMMYGFRAIGGGLYLVGFLLMVVNVIMAVRGAVGVNSSQEVLAEKTEPSRRLQWLTGAFTNDPVAHTMLAVLFFSLWFILPGVAGFGAFIGGLLISARMIWAFFRSKNAWSNWYDKLLENWAPFSILTFVLVAIGGLVQIVPTVLDQRAENIKEDLQELYTPLELAGRDIYVSEGCYNCHSQMIRMLRTDVVRYGEHSTIGMSIYDHPFQWGSKRTGPDLGREGGRQTNTWHFIHMRDPRYYDQNSIMPTYAHLYTKKTDVAALPSKIAVQSKLGVPYPAMSPEEIKQMTDRQAEEIVADLKANGQETEPDKQIVALIAYLQKIGKVTKQADPASPDLATQP